MSDNKTVRITFIEDDKVKTVSVPIGLSVLEAAHQNNISLEGACEGSLSCSTCHVIIDQQFYDKLNQILPASEAEEDMLDYAFGLTKTSRLGCQIIMDKRLDGLIVKLPSATRNL